MKLLAPLLSLKASGNFGNEFVIQNRSGHSSGCLPYSRDDTGSDSQLLYRDNFDCSLEFWRSAQMQATAKSEWLNLCARYSLPMSGYNLFMRWSLLSLRDSINPAFAVYSACYPGGSYAWQLADLRTGGACVDSNLFQVWAWSTRAARTLLFETLPNTAGLVILPAALCPSPGYYLSISVEDNHRSGSAKIGSSSKKTWHELEDDGITWGDVKTSGATWANL